MRTRIIQRIVYKFITTPFSFVKLIWISSSTFYCHLTTSKTNNLNTQQTVGWPPISRARRLTTRLRWNFPELRASESREVSVVTHAFPRFVTASVSREFTNDFSTKVLFNVDKWFASSLLTETAVTKVSQWDSNPRPSDHESTTLTINHHVTTMLTRKYPTHAKMSFSLWFETRWGNVKLSYKTMDIIWPKCVRPILACQLTSDGHVGERIDRVFGVRCSTYVDTRITWSSIRNNEAALALNCESRIWPWKIS